MGDTYRYIRLHFFTGRLFSCVFRRLEIAGRDRRRLIIERYLSPRMTEQRFHPQFRETIVDDEQDTFL